MEIQLITQLDFLMRIFLSGLCGGIIGYERDNRLKEAGIRTHLIVSLASALMMIVSKYGFNDVIVLPAVSLDPSRVAAQIVSGVGFLGAGMIFVRDHAVKGLTTAAGVWATAGIGMAIGSGLYFIGILSTLLILVLQIILHQKSKWFPIPWLEPIRIQIKDVPNALVNLNAMLVSKDIRLLKIKARNREDGYIDVELYLRLPSNYQQTDLVADLHEVMLIRSIET